MQKHIAAVHKKHIALVHKGNKPFKCKICSYSWFQKESLDNHVSSVHKYTLVKPLRIASLNIRRRLYKKEELLGNSINENKCDICCVSEYDLEYVDESKPFSIKGFKTYFPLQWPGTNTKRLLCFVNERIEVIQRTDLMSNLISTVWLELRGSNKKEWH